MCQEGTIDAAHRQDRGDLGRGQRAGHWAQHRQDVCRPWRKVAVLDLLDNAFKDAAASLSGAGHTGLACDVTDQAACQAAAHKVLAAFGRVDILGNNAGITPPVKFLDIAAEAYDAVLDVSLRGMLYLSQAFIPAMKQQGGGSIICMSSVSAQCGGGIFGGPYYSAANASVLGLAKAMAREFGNNGIRVNSITPGLIQTDITCPRAAAAAG